MDSTQGSPGERFNPFTGAWEMDPAQAVPAVGPAGVESAPAPSRRRAGRPARGDAKRTRRVGLSLSVDELELWEQAAAEDGTGSVARWARERVASTLGRPGASVTGGEVAALRADLARMGSNLNQIARALNVAERGGPEGPATAEVLTVVEATRSELAVVRAWTRGQG